MKTPSSISGLVLLVLLLSFSSGTFVFGDDDTNQGWEDFYKLFGCHMGENVTGIGSLKKYLHQFGYFDNVDDYSDEFNEDLERAIQTYQLNFNLNVTGSLDVKTVGQLIQPRCGVADIINGSTSMKSGRQLTTVGNSVAHYSFFPGMPRWSPSQRSLTYAFSLANQPFSAADLRPIIALSFDKWAKATPLKFSETSDYSSADIRIAFFRGDHGDGEPFDGPLGTLAHAFSPENGRLHCDADENWVINVAGLSSARSVDLESVLVHEIGHLLGLGHSSVRDAVMFPSLQTGTKKVDLASDDVNGIQNLYGQNPNRNASITSQQSEHTGAAHSLSLSPLLGCLTAIVSMISLCFLL